jgi:hypothetical protein
MVKRVRGGAVAKSPSMSVTPNPGRLALFGEPQLLEGEDAAAYAELLARIRAAAEPADTIDEMFVADAVALEWEVLRWRRLKVNLIRARCLAVLTRFLTANFDFDLYRDEFVEDLAEVLQDNIPTPHEADLPHTLAQKYVEDEPRSVDQVNRILDGIHFDWDRFNVNLRQAKAKELVQEYAQGKRAAVKRINKLLADAGVRMESLVAEELQNCFDYIERIDSLTRIAENRRNAALREIERRHAPLGERLRRGVHEIEEGEYELLEEKPAKGKTAA